MGLLLTVRINKLLEIVDIQLKDYIILEQSSNKN